MTKRKDWRLVLSLPLPPPVTALGYTSAELKNFMTANEWEQFQKWMIGQTGGVGPNGELLTYPLDAERGIRLIRFGTPTWWD